MTRFFSRSSRLLTICFAGVAAGCAPVPDLGSRPAITQDADIAAQGLARAARADASAWPQARWWDGYGDAQLSALIEEALADAPDVAAAAARLRAARALAAQAEAATGPTLGVEGAVTTVKQSYNNGFPPEYLPQGWNGHGQLAARAGFDLDLFGRNRAALRAAMSEAEAARLDYAQAGLALSTSIADAYATLAEQQAALAVQRDALRVSSQTQSLIADRARAGLETRAELETASARPATARAAIAATEGQLALTRSRIAALLGKGPDRAAAIAPPVAFANMHGLPAGLTTGLIGRRPDIAAARARVEAAAARIDVAHAAFFPDVNLGALVGLQSLGLDKLFDSGSTFGEVGPALSLPVFQSGALSGRYRGARAEYDLAVAQYNATVVQAYRDVADAVTGRDSIARQLAEARAARASYESAYSVAQQRYRGGLSTFLDVLVAEQNVLDARRQVSALNARTLALDVALVRALGGGFSTETDMGAASPVPTSQDD